MNENNKTGIFWGVAVVMLAIAVFVAWPAPQRTEDSLIAGRPLFQEFEDPLAAANMRIVNFDEVLGQLDTFEVRKDRETGRWTIPSRQGYPADAVEQMRDAANSLTGLTILDIQSENAEDHDELGVVEPKLEDLEVGDEGVGRLVTFKDDSQKTLASLIIGNPVDGEEEKIYVRKPGQDPVYVVRLDDSPLTTRFRDWIEKDLLQLSSIDIAQVEVKDYNAAIGGGRFSLTRNYSAQLSVDESEWTVDEVLVYDPDKPLAEPEKAPVDPDAVPNATKLNAMKDALDELEIVDVARKPDGLSANLKAEKELVSDNDAITSLAQRGFFPVELGPEGEAEVLSANGEIAVTLRDGVRYILRFGNAAGLSEDADEGEDDEEGQQPVAGINRYLLVTTEVDESWFPTPDLRSVPETLEDLRAMLRGDDEESEAAAPDAAEPGDAKSENPEPEAAKPENPEPEGGDSNDATADPSESAGDSEPEDSEPEDSEPEEPATDDANESDEPTDDSSSEENPGTDPSGEETPADDEGSDDEGSEPESDGDGESDGESGSNGEEDAGSEDDASSDPSGDDGESQPSGESDPPNDDGSESGEGSESGDDESKPADEPSDEEPEPADEPGDDGSESAAEPSDDEPESADEPADDTPSPQEDATPSELEGLTEDERLERLEAEQEKITKENQRKLDERNDQIEAARQRVRELNFRFADWYYVIPESTYQDLRIRRSELFADESASDDTDSAPSTPLDLPNFNAPAPGAPGTN